MSVATGDEGGMLAVMDHLEEDQYVLHEEEDAGQRDDSLHAKHGP